VTHLLLRILYVNNYSDYRIS